MRARVYVYMCVCVCVCVHTLISEFNSNNDIIFNDDLIDRL